MGELRLRDGKELQALDSSRPGRAVNCCLPWLSSPEKTPTAGKLLHPHVSGGCWSCIIPVWCPDQPTFNKLYPSQQDETFLPANLCLLSSNPSISHPYIQFPPFYPHRLLTFLYATLELLPASAFSLSPFLGLLEVWRGVKCQEQQARRWQLLR